MIDDPLLLGIALAAPATVVAIIVSRIVSLDLIYLNTRFNVIGNPNMSSRRLSEALTAADLREAARRLHDRYFPVEDAASLKEADERVRAVNRRFLEETVERVPWRIRPFFTVLLMRHEVDEVRAACAAIEAGRTPEVRLVGRIDGDLAARIARAASAGEAMTTYLEAIGRPPAEDVADRDLDVALLHEMAGAASRLRGLLGRPLAGLMRTMLDAELVRLALRLHVHGTPGLLGELDLPEGYEVPAWLLADIAADPATGIRNLEGTALSEAAAETGPAEIEAALRRSIVRRADWVYAGRFMTVGPLTRFLLLREMEAVNVRAVLMAAASGMRWADVERMMATEGGA